jgi:hypothetical protein
MWGSKERAIGDARDGSYAPSARPGIVSMLSPSKGTATPLQVVPSEYNRPHAFGRMIANFKQAYLLLNNVTRFGLNHEITSPLQQRIDGVAYKCVVRQAPGSTCSGISQKTYF